MYGENLEWWERWSMSQLTFCRFWVLHKPLEESSVAGTWPSGWTDPIKEDEWISVEIQKTLAAFSARPQGLPEVKGLSRVNTMECVSTLLWDRTHSWYFLPGRNHAKLRRIGWSSCSFQSGSKFELLRWSCTVASEFANVINVGLTKHCASMRGAW